MSHVCFAMPVARLLLCACRNAQSCLADVPLDVVPCAAPAVHGQHACVLRGAHETGRCWCRYEQVKALKEGKTVQKPIYNHVSGLLDPPEATTAPKVLIIEGLHPFYDERVSELCDYKIYLDISDEVKFAWKIQRDMKERGHSLESIKASIEARKPDFDKYIDPQKAKADLVIQVRPAVPAPAVPPAATLLTPPANPLRCSHDARSAGISRMCCGSVPVAYPAAASLSHILQQRPYRTNTPRCTACCVEA
jgi:Phosphoribulokinase / Uridine kinase family